MWKVFYKSSIIVLIQTYILIFLWRFSLKLLPKFFYQIKIGQVCNIQYSLFPITGFKGGKVFYYVAHLHGPMSSAENPRSEETRTGQWLLQIKISGSVGPRTCDLPYYPDPVSRPNRLVREGEGAWTSQHQALGSRSTSVFPSEAVFNCLFGNSRFFCQQGPTERKGMGEVPPHKSLAPPYLLSTAHLLVG